jgi:hypothetical protein
VRVIKEFIQFLLTVFCRN